MRSPLFMVLAAVGVAGGVMVCVLVPGCKPETEGLVVLFGGNNDGVIAACGCPGNPSGGFAKRQGLVEKYRDSRPATLLIDAGNLFPTRENKIKTRYLAQAARRAGYDAIACGVAEFLLGAERLRELQNRYDLPLICANVRDAETHQLVAAPHVVLQRKGFTIGVFAVIADWTYGFPALEWREGLDVEDPVAAARRQAEALSTCDLVVAVTHMPIGRTKALLRQVEGIDVCIFGHEPATYKEIEHVGGASLVGTNEAGNFLGALTLRSEKADGETRVAMDHDMTYLSSRVPGAEWVEKLYWRYVEEAKVEEPPSWDTPVPEKFEPAEACAKCHKPEYQQWKTTAHARAYESIKKEGRNDDPECVLCHTMGFGRKGGFVSMEETPELGRVTCQACHVVTSDHHEKGVKPEPRINISSRWCMSCHGPVQSPEFDIYVYKPKILHHPRDGNEADRD